MHLTGTNGKTSTARMVDALLSEIGLRTGRYTSPHLQLATERISIDGRPITPERYVEVYRDVRRSSSWSTPGSGDAVQVRGAHRDGFAAFADAPVEAGIVEVGLGGRWDATNVADGHGRGGHPDRRWTTPSTSATTCSSIAREKAGIIKPGAVAVLAAQEHAVARCCWSAASRWSAQVAREGSEFGVAEREVAVGGQRLDAAGARRGGTTTSSCRCTASTRPTTPRWRWPRPRRWSGPGRSSRSTRTRSGAAFASVASPGRLERLAAGAGVPTVLVDAAHNPHGARALAAALTSEFRFNRLVGVVGVMADKDARGHPGRAGAGAATRWSSRPTPRRGRWTRTSSARWPSRCSAPSG